MQHVLKRLERLEEELLGQHVVEMLHHGEDAAEAVLEADDLALEAALVLNGAGIDLVEEEVLLAQDPVLFAGKSGVGVLLVAHVAAHRASEGVDDKRQPVLYAHDDAGDVGPLPHV